MSIWEIEKRILEEAAAEAEKAQAECEHTVAQLEKVHAQNKAKIKGKLVHAAEQQVEEAKRAELIPARLQARRLILEEKQKILSGIYKEIKKEKKLSGPELQQLREKSEVAASEILFGE